MDKKFGKDLTVGIVPKHLLAFSIPMLIGNMLQSGYSVINMIWIGNIVGENGLGAAQRDTGPFHDCRSWPVSANGIERPRVFES
jgi:hypothetical protein